MTELMRRRRALMGANSGSDIVLIEYLQAPSSPYSAAIVTDKKVSDFDVISVDMKTRVSADKNNIVISSWRTDNNSIQDPRLATIQAGCTGYTLTSSLTANVRGTLEATIASSSTYLLRIGAWGSNIMSKARTYYGDKLYKNSVLLADYKPAYRKSDNVTGVFDAVSGEFFPEMQHLDGYVRGPVI